MWKMWEAVREEMATIKQLIVVCTILLTTEVYSNAGIRRVCFYIESNTHDQSNAVYQVGVTHSMYKHWTLKFEFCPFQSDIYCNIFGFIFKLFFNLFSFTRIEKIYNSLRKWKIWEKQTITQSVIHQKWRTFVEAEKRIFQKISWTLSYW